MKAPAKQQTTEELLSLMFEVSRITKNELYREGLAMPSFMHMVTLLFIQDREQQGKAPTMSDIAEYLKVARPSATTLVNSFVKDGIITRVADSEDRRLVRLSIARKGTRLLEDTMQKRVQAFSRVVSSLSEKDCQELTRILMKITRPT